MKRNTKYTQINRNKSMHTDIGPLRQNCSSKCAYNCAQKKLEYVLLDVTEKRTTEIL